MNCVMDYVLDEFSKKESYKIHQMSDPNRGVCEESLPNTTELHHGGKILLPESRRA